jgi:toxin YoeB
MKIQFTNTGWSEYTYWQTQDKKTLKRINLLIQDVVRNGNTGTGKPEALAGNLTGWWSRRIDEANRMVYRIIDENIEISQCCGHYNDK